MTVRETGQVIKSAAEIYDDFFVPALFGEWPAHVLAAANVEPGDEVLDVACGTGVLTRSAAEAVGPTGTVTGLDINPGMLAVAQQKAPVLTFREGRAEALPFDADRFDAVVSQFGLMFFEDRVGAIREMVRVLRPGGTLAVAVWDGVENVEGYPALSALLERLYGAEIGAAVRAPFVLGDTDELTALFAEAGLPHVRLSHKGGTMRFPSLRAWLNTEIRGWILADRVDDAQFEAFYAQAEKVLDPYVGADGSVRLAAPAHIVTATPR